MKKNIKKLLIFAIFFLLTITLGKIDSKAGNLYLDELDFKTQINSNGSIDVTETWNIDIQNTNTLYKSFKTDSSKYSKITNVSVKEIKNGQATNFLKTNAWAYHVTKGYYYGTENEDGDFEIGWGVGLDSSSANRVYQISYTVEDAITKYNDYAELYWQFVGEDFEISASKITGTIYLPSHVSNKEDIKVWGHTEDLNGTIYATDTNKIQFNVNNFKSGRYVEIRTLFPTKLITTTGRTKNSSILQSAINEETKWADNANKKREMNKLLKNVLIIGWILLNILLVIAYIKKMIKYLRKIKELKKYKPTTELEYYRDIPYENATPGEAIKTLNINITAFTSTNFGKIFSATMLDLALKGYLEIQQEKNEKGKDVINIYIRKRVEEGLKSSEGHIMKFILGAAGEKEKLTLKELEKYIKEHPSRTEILLKSTYNAVDEQLIDENIIDKEQKNEYNKYKSNALIYVIVAIILFCLTSIAFIIPTIIFVIDAIMCVIISKKINVLTQKGVDTKEEWKGLKKYMEDFSMLDRREVPELVIWEKFLVYATTFGIADKVIKQLKMVYPDFDEMVTTNHLTTYSYMNLMINTDFSRTFSNAISSSISSSYSSGSGSGGGFSGGGGGGRRPEVAEEEDNAPRNRTF